MRKRFAALMLALLLCVTMLPGAALAEDQTPLDTGIYMSAVDNAPSGECIVGNFQFEYLSNSQTSFTFYYYDANAEALIADNYTVDKVNVDQVGNNFWKVTLKKGVSGNVTLVFSTGENRGFPVFLTDLTPPPTTGIYMEMDEANNAPSGDVIEAEQKDDGNGNRPWVYDLSYSSKSQNTFAFYYYNAQAEEFVGKNNTANKVSIDKAGSNFWKVTLNQNVSGDQSLIFLATSGNGYSNEFPVSLTDLTPPIPEGFYTAHDGNGAPVTSTRVPENPDPNGLRYILPYTAGTKAVFYYYNENITGVSAEGWGTAITAKGEHLWEIEIKVGWRGDSPLILRFTRNEQDAGALYAYADDSTTNEAGGWIPNYTRKDPTAGDGGTVSDAIASTELGLRTFFYNGGVYYFGFLADDMVSGGYDGRDGAIYSILEPNIFTLHDNNYEPVPEGQLRDALESYLGEITLTWYAEVGSTAQAVPLRYSCLVDCKDPSDYYWRFGDENLGIWYLTATAENLNLSSVAKVKHYKNSETTIAASGAMDLQMALYNCANNPNADFDNTTYVFEITAPEFYGYVTIPAQLKHVQIIGATGDYDTNTVTWYGGINTGDAGDDNYMRVVVQHINFVSPAEDKTAPVQGEGNEIGPNVAIYGERSANVMFCSFEGYYHAVDFSGLDSFYVTASQFTNNYVGVYAETVYGLDIDSNRFTGNDIGIWLKDLPRTAIINDYNLRYIAFINNGVDIQVNFPSSVQRPFFAPYNYFDGEAAVEGTVYTYPTAKNDGFSEFNWETGGTISNSGDYRFAAHIIFWNPVKVMDDWTGKTVGIWNFGGDGQ